MNNLFVKAKSYHAQSVLLFIWFKSFSNQWYELKASKQHVNVLVGLSFFMTIFSPVVAWAFSLLLLTLLSSSMNTFGRRLLGFNVILTGALAIASRLTLANSQDDLFSYFRAYNGLLSGNMDALFAYNNEVGLPLLYFLHTKLFESAEPASIILYVSFLCGVLFLVWLEYFGVKEIEEELKSLAIAASLIFFSFMMTSQVIREMMAMVFILYALSSHKIIFKTILLFLGVLFHTAALPVFIMGALLFKFPKQTFIGVLFISGTFVFELSNLQTIYSSLDMSFIPIQKLLFHACSLPGYTQTDMYYVKFMFILIVLFLFQFLFLKADPTQEKWKYFVLTFAGMYLIFLPLPLASLRGTLIVNSVLLGYLIFIGFKQYYRLFSDLLAGYIIYKFILTVNGFPGPFELWHAYGWYGKIPFYYWVQE